MPALEQHAVLELVADGINRSTLSKILNLKGYSTGTDVLDKLCAYFGRRIEDLVEYVAE